MRDSQIERDGDWREPGAAMQWRVVARSGQQELLWLCCAHDRASAEAGALADAEAASTILSGGKPPAEPFTIVECVKIDEDDAGMAVVRPNSAMRRGDAREDWAKAATIPVKRPQQLARDILDVAASKARLPDHGDIVLQAGSWGEGQENLKNERLVDIGWGGDVNLSLTLPQPLRTALLALSLTCGKAHRFSLYMTIDVPESSTLRASLQSGLSLKRPEATARIASFLREVGLPIAADQITSLYGEDVRPSIVGEAA
mgnify:CR=1 FL=1